jgi:uroporphyrinogen-III synthase
MLKNKITILSTGILDRQLADKAFDQDIIIEIIPFISTRPLDPADLRALLKPLTQQTSFVVFTSSKAVEAVAANVETHPEGWTFCSIGHATQRAVRKHFGASDISASADNATELAKEIIAYGIFEELLFFCSDHRRDELPDQLRAAGIRVKEVVTYETTLTPEKIEHPYDGILFFSPSAVQSFFSMNQVPPGTVLFSIGSTTAAALQTYTTNKIIIADKPDKEEIVQNVIEYFNK